MSNFERLPYSFRRYRSWYDPSLKTRMQKTVSMPVVTKCLSIIVSQEVNVIAGFSLVPESFAWPR